MKKPTLYVDLDGVIADFNKAIFKLAPDLDLSEHSPDYESRSKLVDKLCQDNSNLFRHLEPMVDGIEAVKLLFPHYEVYFLSTPMWAVPDSFGDKRIWLETHFGDLAHKRLILTHRKDLNVGEYLIDDRFRNGAGEFTGEHIHFGGEKFPDWRSVLEYLMPKE